jgi:hypothetical protein
MKAPPPDELEKSTYSSTCTRRRANAAVWSCARPLGSPHLDDLGGPRDGARELRYRS